MSAQARTVYPDWLYEEAARDGLETEGPKLSVEILKAFLQFRDARV